MATKITRLEEQSILLFGDLKGGIKPSPRRRAGRLRREVTSLMTVLKDGEADLCRRIMGFRKCRLSAGEKMVIECLHRSRSREISSVTIADVVIYLDDL